MLITGCICVSYFRNFKICAFHMGTFSRLLDGNGQVTGKTFVLAGYSTGWRSPPPNPNPAPSPNPTPAHIPPHPSLASNDKAVILNTIPFQCATLLQLCLVISRSISLVFAPNLDYVPSLSSLCYIIRHAVDIAWPHRSSNNIRDRSGHGFSQ